MFAAGSAVAMMAVRHRSRVMRSAAQNHRTVTTSCHRTFAEVAAARAARLTILQYNILAGSLGQCRHFTFSRPEFLDWNLRRERILRTVLDVDADVVCLEELDDYWTFFGPVMRKHGFESVYGKRSSLFAQGR